MRDRLLAAEKVRAIEWQGDALSLLDQRAVPTTEVWRRYGSVQEVAEAIRLQVVSGAPAIGISAAFGVVLAARARLAAGGDWREALATDIDLLAASRPSAADLSWALNRMRERLARLKPSVDPLAALEAEAHAIHQSDRDANLTMAQLGIELIRKHQGSPQNLLTHGNAGALASGGFGTALGVIRAAYLDGLVERIYAGETRPWSRGARLTGWELGYEGVPVSVIADSTAAHLMKTRGVTWVIVGAERITANGDVLNRIGTYQLAISAMHHGARFMVVAPSSSIDADTAHGDDLPLEEQDGRELLASDGQGGIGGMGVFDPVFDVTPADLVDAIVTERGIVERPDAGKLERLLSRKRLH